MKNKKIDYVKPVKHLEIFEFERFEYSYSKHVFSKETKSNNAFKLLLVCLLHFGNSGINKNTDDRCYSSWYVSDGLVYCLYQGKHNAITCNLTCKGNVTPNPNPRTGPSVMAEGHAV